MKQAAQKHCIVISVPRGLQDPAGQNLKQSGVNWVLPPVCVGGWTVALPRAVPREGFTDFPASHRVGLSRVLLVICCVSKAVKHTLIVAHNVGP